MKRYVIIGLLLGLVTIAPALAQDTPIVIDTIPNTIGIGIAMVPDYMGSDDYRAAIGPMGRLSLGGERFIQLSGPFLSSNLLNHPHFQLGPALQFRPERDDVEDDVVDRMQDIDATIEGGLIVGVRFVDPGNPRKRFSAGMSFLHDLGGEHEGFTFDIDARAWWPLGRAFDLGLGVGVTFADDDFMDTYFSVSAGDAMRSGLPVFKADGGVRDFRVFPVLVMHLSRHWHLAAALRYSRLVADAEDSPIVDDRGSPNQLAAGLGVAYAW